MADLVKNIIFKITSQTAPGYLMDLKAGYDMFTGMYNATRKYIDAAEELLDVQGRLQIDISKVNTTVRGLTGSLNLAQSANRLSMADYKVTAQQFADLSKYAAVWADATGKKTPEALDQLVSALISGRERGLRPFGISVDETKDKGAKFNDILQQIGEKAQEASIEVDTLREKQESWGDAVLVYGANVVAGYESIHSQSERMNKYFTESAVFRGENNENIGLLGWLKKTIYEMDNARLAAAEMDKQMLAIDEGRWISTDIPEQQFSWAGSEKGDWYKDTMSMGKTVNVTPSPYVPPEAEPRRGGGGGGRKKEAYKPIEAEKLATIGVIDTDEQSLALEQNDKFLEQIKSQQLKATQDSLASTANARELAYNYEVEQTRIKEEQILELQQRRYDIEADVMQTRKITQMEMALGVDQRYVNESARIWRSGLQGKMATMGVFFNAVSQLMTVKSKAMFQVGKAAAIAEGLVNTYLGAIKAYQSMCGLGPWGVALGIIAAAAVTAAGLANVNRIRAMEYGKDGGGGGSMGGSTSIGTGGGESALPSSQPGGGGYNGPPQQQEQKVVIEINMGDSALFLDAVVDQNDKASQTGRRYFARAR